MIETKQEKRESLIEQVRQMAGTEVMTALEWQEEEPLVLPDGYHRRSPLQPCRQGGNRFRWQSAALIVLLAAAVITLAVIVILRFQ